MTPLQVAAIRKCEAEISEATAVLNLYLNDPLAVADHSDILDEIDKWLSLLAAAKDKLKVLNELLGEQYNETK